MLGTASRARNCFEALSRLSPAAARSKSQRAEAADRTAESTETSRLLSGNWGYCEALHVGRMTIYSEHSSAATLLAAESEIAAATELGGGRDPVVHGHLGIERLVLPISRDQLVAVHVSDKHASILE